MWASSDKTNNVAIMPSNDANRTESPISIFFRIFGLPGSLLCRCCIDVTCTYMDVCFRVTGRS